MNVDAARMIACATYVPATKLNVAGPDPDARSGAEILYVRVGAQARIVGEIPANNLIAAPIPAFDNVVIVRSDRRVGAAALILIPATPLILGECSDANQSR